MKHDLSQEEVVDFKTQYCNENASIATLLRERFLRWIEPPILDVGCGIGDISRTAFPDVEAVLGIPNFEQALGGANAGQLFFDETIWRPQLQECPATGYAVPCPDCGGTGDLRFAIARFVDTCRMSGSDRKLVGSP